MQSRAGRKRDGSRSPLPLILLTAGLLASVLAVHQTLSLARRLPVVALRDPLFPAGRWNAIISQRLRAAGGEVREAYLMDRAARLISEALTQQTRPATLRAQLSQLTAEVHGSQLARLQLAAGRLWYAEQAHIEPQRWWQVVGPLLSGLEQGDFAHHLPALTDLWAGSYEAVGVGPGTARLLAVDAVGRGHGIVAQYFCQRLRRIEDLCRQQGQSQAAETCRLVRRRWLDQWVGAPGPVWLRMLAADLLADDLASDQPDAAEALRTWRDAYRQMLAQRPLDLIAPYKQPSLVPRRQQRLARQVVWNMWLAGAWLVATLAAVVGSWWLLKAGRPPGRAALVGQLVGVAVALIGAPPRDGPAALTANLLADFSSWAWWPPAPLRAAAATLLAVAWIGLAARRVSRRPCRQWWAAATAAMWLVLALVLAGNAVSAERSRRDYEQALAAAVRDPLRAVLGAEAPALPPELEHWQPAHR